jgi:pimeloyl-ACP methyl ester carboxylesterase
MSSDPEGPRHLELADGSRLAYRALPGESPTVVFLGGFTSDMTGTKATALAEHCRRQGRAFVRFDYFGHGASSGRFEDAALGRWVGDALAVIDRVVRGPVVLVGSSMGGWLMVLAALARPDRVVGLVGVASAPDFTEELIAPRLDGAAREALRTDGVTLIPNPYGPEPTPVTKRFLEEARQHLVLGYPLALRCPVRLLHGLADQEVPWGLSLRLAQAIEGEDVTLTLVKGGDHRLSDAADLSRLTAALQEVLAAWEEATRGERA